MQYTQRPQALVDECRRVLKPGGEAIFQVYNRVSWLNALSKLMKVPLEHEDAPVLAQVQRRASSARLLTGFRDVRIVEERFPVKSRLHGGWKGTLFNTVLRRHLQRAAAAPGAPLRLAPARVLPQMRPHSARQGARLRQRLLLMDARDVAAAARSCRRSRARVCDRHRGIGADGLIVYSRDRRAARRCGCSTPTAAARRSRATACAASAAWLASQRGGSHGRRSTIETDAGTKRLELLASERTAGYTFRAAMGQPEQIALEPIDVDGRTVEAVTLRVGNPQCVVLGEVTEERLHTLASALAVHPRFPEGTNVELATVEAPDRVRILIWERGVGPTEASGTGACAAAVAAIRTAAPRATCRSCRPAARSASSGPPRDSS